jgi:XTP/dITP diphosphohydrolase
MKNNKLHSIEKLLKIMDELREKCPWDKEQTMDSLKILTIEESYELIEAINEENFEEIKNELGDLLLHIIFYSKIASEKSKFDFSDVIKSISDKLINRHPHVFQNKNKISRNEVEKNWEKIKLNEGRNSILSGVPKTLPSLIKSIRIQKKASNSGFTFNSTYESKAKVYEELEELNEEIKLNNLEKIESEYGDFLFSIINYGNSLGLNPDNALEKANKKFINRFKKMEINLKKDNLIIDQISKKILLKYWQKSK